MNKIAAELGIARRKLPVKPVIGSCRAILAMRKKVAFQKNSGFFFAPLATIL